MRSKYLGHRGSKAGHNVGESWTRDDGTRVTKVGPDQYREESPGGMAGRPATQHEDQSRLPPAVRERAQQASDGMTAQMQDATDMASHRLAGEGASPQQQAAARQSVLGALGRGIRGMLQEYGQAHARDNPDMNRGPLHLASWAVTRAWQALRQKLGGKALLRRQAKFLHLAKDFDPEAAQQAAGDIQGLLDTLAGHLNVTAPKIDARELYSGGKGLWGRKWLGRRSGRKSHDLADRIWQAIRFSGPMREITATREQDDDSIDMLVQEIEDEARYAGSALDAEQIWDDIYDAVHRHQGYDRAEAIQRVLRMAIREAGHLSKSLAWLAKAARYKPGEVRTRKDGSKWTLNPATGKVERVRGEGRGGGRKKEEAPSESQRGGDDESGIDLSGWDNPNADESGIDLSGWDNPNADESGIDLSGWDKEDARTKESRQLLSQVQQGISSLKWTQEEEAAIHRQAESYARKVGPQRASQMIQDIQRKADQQGRSLKEAGMPDTVVATLNQVLIAYEMADQGMPLPDSYIQRLHTVGQNAFAYVRSATGAGRQGKSLPFYGIKAQRRKEGEIWKRRDGTEWTKLNGRIVPHRQPGQGRGGRPQPSRESVGKLQSGLQSARGDLAKLILRDDQKAVSKLVASQFQQAGIKVNPGRVQKLVAGIVDKHGDITSQGDAHTIAENITRQARQQAAKLAVVPRGPRQSAEPAPEPQAEAGEQQQLERLKQFPGPDVIRSIDEQSAKLPVDRQQALARAFVLLAQSQEELLDQARTPRDQLQTLRKLTRMAVDTLGRFGIQIPQEKLTEYGLR